jgi:hypothetical protein
MRIICTVTNDLSHDQRMIRICTSLQQAGYDVCLVGRSLPDSPPLRTRPFRQHRLRCWFHRGKLFYLEYQLRLWYYLYQQPAAAHQCRRPGYLATSLSHLSLAPHSLRIRRSRILHRDAGGRTPPRGTRYLVPARRVDYSSADLLLYRRTTASPGAKRTLRRGVCSHSQPPGTR